MSKYRSTILICVFFIIGIFISQSSLSNFISIIILIVWARNYLNNKLSIATPFLLTLVYELLTLSPPGALAVSLAITYLIIYFVRNILNIIHEDNPRQFFLLGLTSNTILFLIIRIIITQNFNLVFFVGTIVINVIVFILFTRLVKTTTAFGYA